MLRRLVISLLLFASALSSCGEEPIAPAGAGRATSVVSTFVGPGYGGVDACVDCHRERVESYRRTAHFKTLRRPEPDEFAARVESAGGRLTTRDPALSFEISRVDDQVFQESILDLGTRQVRRREEIAFIMGSGRIFEGYLAWEDDRLIQLPVGWFGEAATWSNCPGYPDGELHFDREILPRCLDCHGTWAETRGGARYDPESLIPGLSCERCHGPGRDHVEHHRAHPDDEEGRAIVKPAELDRERRLDLCAQCHAEPGELLGEPFHYLPGTPLAEYVRQEGGHGSDVFVHTANQIQRLASSPCFSSSTELDCLSCHRTHAPEGESLVRRSLRTCGDCHAEGHCGAGASLPGDLRGACLDCHMPERQVSDTTINTRAEDFLDFFRMTEHRIGVYPEARIRTEAEHEIAAGRAERGQAMLAELADLLRGRAAEKERAHRFVESMALLREAGRLDPSSAPSAERLESLARRERRRGEALGMLDELRALVRGGRLDQARSRAKVVLELDPGQPEVLALLGEIARLEGRLDEAEKLLRAALAARPDFADAAMALAELQLASGRPGEARDGMAALGREKPRLAGAFLLLARARAELGETEAALEALELYLAREPMDELARLNRAALLLELGRPGPALEVATTLALSRNQATLAAVARFFQRLRQVGRARSLWEVLIDDPRHEAAARVGLAELALDGDDLARAEELLAPLAGRDDDAEVLAAEARLARRANRRQEAELLLRRALRAPGDPDAAHLESLRLLASLRGGDPERVLARAEIVLASRSGRDPVIMLEIAELQAAAGRDERARALLDAALARPETELIPGLREKIRAARARLYLPGRDD